MLLIQKLKLAQYILIFNNLSIVSLTVSYLISFGPLGSLVGYGDGSNATSPTEPRKRQQLVRVTQPYKIFMGAQTAMAPILPDSLIHTYIAI